MKKMAHGGFRGWCRNLSTLNKLLAWSAGLLCCYAVLGFIVLPLAAQKVLEKKLPAILHRPVTIGKISLNPFTFSLVVEKFHSGERQGSGSFVDFERLRVDLELSSLFRKALIVKEITLNRPYLEFSRLDRQTYSFSDLLATPEEPGNEKASAFYFALQNIVISDGGVLFHDLPKGSEHQVTGLELAIPALSNLPYQVETYVQPAFSATINGTKFSLGGQTKPFADSLETVMAVKVDGLDLAHYLAYIPNDTGLVLRSALLDIDTSVHLLARPDNTYRLALQGKTALRELAIADNQGQDYLQLPELEVVLADSDLLAGEVHLSEVSFDRPALRLERRQDGSLLPIALLAGDNSGSKAGSDHDPPTKEAPSDEADKKAAPVNLTIDRLVLNQGQVDFLDEAVAGREESAGPVALGLSEIGILSEGLSTAPDRQGNLTLSCNINQAGSLQIQGSLGIEPLQGELELTLDSLALQPLQPYISEQARIVLAGGALSVSGDVSLIPQEAGATGTRFRGRGDLSGLATVDTVMGEDLLKWGNLGVEEISYSSEPGSLDIGAITFTNLYAKALINSDGVFNLSTIRPGVTPGGEAEVPATDTDQPPPAPETPETANQPGQPFVTTVGSVSIIGGRLDYLDRQVNPAYGATLSELRGGIRNLSSEAGTSAEVDFSGKLDGQAPLKISGRINPLSEELFVDLKIDFTDINLSPMSPYTGKYLGYKTDKGKLNLDLKYDIVGSRLDSDNKAFLDQFTLGDTVDSPDAAKLPISLAVTLLKNRQGEIQLDVPVQGDLNDPDFSVGGVIIQVLVNLIAKAATSPFALLGALIPEGQDLQYIAFKPGSPELEQAETEKLVTLTRVLFERPGLKMDVVGKIDPRADAEALARARLLTGIKLQKLLASGQNRPATAGGTATVELSPEEYSLYLPAAYKAARKAEPERKPAEGPISQESMEAFILGGINIGREDLRLLALDRANKVLANLVASGQVEPGRLFVVEPVNVEDTEAATLPQVELLIK